MWWSRGIVTPTSCESHRCSSPQVGAQVAPRKGRSCTGRCTPRSTGPASERRPRACTARSAGTATAAWSTAARPTTAPRSAAGGSARVRPPVHHRGDGVSLTVIKRSGASEPFSRDKVLVGVRKACQGRPVTEDDLALLAQRVEETVRASGVAEIEAHEVGMAVLPPLRELDEVAYLRFASVYRAFDDLEALRVRDRAAPCGARRARADATEHRASTRNTPRGTPGRSADRTFCRCRRVESVAVSGGAGMTETSQRQAPGGPSGRPQARA